MSLGVGGGGLECACGKVAEVEIEIEVGAEVLMYVDKEEGLCVSNVLETFSRGDKFQKWFCG